MSHFKLYLAAMAEIGAEARPIFALVMALQGGSSLERALEERHGPRARRLLLGLCEGRAEAWDQAKIAAREALRARRRLWDGIVLSIEASAPDSAPAA